MFPIRADAPSFRFFGSGVRKRQHPPAESVRLCTFRGKSRKSSAWPRIPAAWWKIGAAVPVRSQAVGARQHHPSDYGQWGDLLPTGLVRRSPTQGPRQIRITTRSTPGALGRRGLPSRASRRVR
jgi:hypothetical protein